MRANLPQRILAASLMLLQSLAAVAQENHSIDDVLKAKVAPETIKLDALTDEYRAVEIRTVGELDMGMFDPIQTIGNQPGMSGQVQMYKLRSLFWTKGEEVTIAGSPFLVAYKLVGAWPTPLYEPVATIPPGPPQTNPSTAAQPVHLQLQLIRESGIQSISVQTDITKSTLLDALHMDVSIKPGIQIAAAPPRPQVNVADETLALSNIKQVSLGMLMYSSDYDDVMPYPQAMPALRFVLSPYLKSKTVWTDPNPRGGMFTFNHSLGGVNMSAIPEPTKTVMFYESQSWPDGTRAVSFVDGHAKRFNAGQWKSIAATLRRKYLRTAKPLPAKYGVGK